MPAWVRVDQRDTPAASREFTGEMERERRLPDAVAPEQTDDLTLGDREVHTLKDVALAVVGMQISYVEHHAASVPR